MILAAEIFVGFLLTVAVLALIARKVTIPYPVLFVIGGLVLSRIPGLPKIFLDPESVFFFILPPLLYPAALFTSWRDFRANLRPIALLAVGLVLFTMVAIAYFAHYFLGLPLAAGFVLGAIVSPPDAIAATAITDRLKVPRQIVTILEGESLVNDATALVALRFAIAAVVAGTFSFPQATLSFFVVALGGNAVGLAVGWLAALFHRRVKDPQIEVTVSLLTPFATYLLAERLGVSGVLAVVTAGLYLGMRAPEILTFKTRLQGGPVWDTLEFLLNGFVFLLIGLELREVLQVLAGHAYPVQQLIRYAFLISLAVILIRILWVFPATYLPRLIFKRLCRNDPHPPWRRVAIVGWAGMRGVVSLAAALSVPLTLQNGAPFPGRDLILFLTFVVIMATLVVQGLSLPLLIRLLGIHEDGSMEHEERRARLEANRAALARLEGIANRDTSLADTFQRLRVEYEDHIRQLEGSDPNRAGTALRLFSTEYERLSREALHVERSTLIKLRNQDVISDEVLRRVQRDIDLAEARLRDHQ